MDKITDTPEIAKVGMGDQVMDLLKVCFFADGEDTSDAVLVKGISQNFGFHHERLAANKDKIRALLLRLDPNFLASKGGGWSFLNGCVDCDGSQWGGQPTVEALMVLGLATGLVEYLMPRELWSSLPGGVPYFVVKDV